MTLNPVWFGVLMTIVAEIILVIIGAMVRTARMKDDGEDEFNGELTMSEEEFREIIEKSIRESVDSAVKERMNGKEK